MIDQIRAAIEKNPNLRAGSLRIEDGKAYHIIDEIYPFDIVTYLGEDGRIREEVYYGDHLDIWAYPSLEAFETFQQTGEDVGAEWLGNNEKALP